MAEFTGRCYGGTDHGRVKTHGNRVWVVPVCKPTRIMDMWAVDETVALEPFKTLTYRLDRVIENATSKRWTSMFRETTFFLCDGHKLTLSDRSQILTDLRQEGWQRRDIPAHGSMSAHEYAEWEKEAMNWETRPVVLATQRHMPLRSYWDIEPIEIESPLYGGSAIPENLIG